MPIFVTLFTGIFSWFMSVFALFLTKKFAQVAAVVTAMTALTAALVALFTGLLTGIQASLPPGGELAFAMLPPNTTPCLGAYASAVIAKWVYDWNHKIIQYTLF